MGHLNLGGIASAGKFPERGRTDKTSKETTDVFKNLIQERQDAKEDTVSGDKADSKKEETTVKEKDDKWTAENSMYTIFQMNPVAQSIQIPEAETAEGGEMQEEVLLEGVGEILSNTEEVPEMAGNLVPQQEKMVAVQGGQPVENLQTPEVKEESKVIPNMETTEVQALPETEKPETSVRNVKEEVQPLEKSAGRTEELKTDRNEKQERRVVSEEEKPTEAAVQGQTVTVQKHETEVKQNEPAARMEVRQPEEIPEKLTEHLLTKLSRGVKEFEIQIEPENLGKIAVKILYEQGQTTVSILCSERKTMELMARNAREIGNVMEQNLGDSTKIIVEEQKPDYLNQEKNDNDHTGRDSEQERQKEENNKHKAQDSQQFLQKLRLGLTM